MRHGAWWCCGRGDSVESDWVRAEARDANYASQCRLAATRAKLAVRMETVSEATLPAGTIEEVFTTEIMSATLASSPLPHGQGDIAGIAIVDPCRSPSRRAAEIRGPRPAPSL